MMRVRTHPGEVLREEFMVPLGISANALARDLDVPPNRITGIIADRDPRAVTPDTALRLAAYFGTSAEFWINLQSAYDLSLAQMNHGNRIARRVRPRATDGDLQAGGTSGTAAAAPAPRPRQSRRAG
jgi:addiction module HigA family antidote